MNLIFVCFAFLLSSPTAAVPEDLDSFESSESFENSEEEDPLKFLKCETGEFWSLSLDRCRPCSACGEQLYERSSCALTFDTRCEWCLAEFPVINDDYIAKCMSVADRVFYEEQRLNTGLGARVLQRGRESAYRFWNFEQLPPSNDETVTPERDTEKAPVRCCFPRVTSDSCLRIASAVMLRVLVFVVPIFSIVFLLHYYLRHRSRAVRYVTKTVPALQFSDEQNQAIVSSARELERIIGKEGYERLQDPQFV